MSELGTFLRSRSNRCSGCGYHVETQGCACEGQRLKVAGQSIASAAHPDERAKVDAAIRQLAATGRPFSANDARQIHGVVGGVVGAAFTAARKAGLIRRIGREPSSAKSTHGHEISQWISAAVSEVAA